MKFLLRENINKEAMAIVHQPNIFNLVSSIKLTMLFVSSAIEKTKKKGTPFQSASLSCRSAIHYNHPTVNMNAVTTKN